MQTTLPSRSLIIKEKLDNIVKEVLEVIESRAAMIILFGSYARGDWVRDEYKKGHVTYSYQSDLDILVLIKKYKCQYLKSKIEEKIEERLQSKSLIGTAPEELWATFIFESIDHVNKQLEQGHYFFSDIKKEGVLLYDSGEFQLAEHKELPWHKKKKIAEVDYKHWFERGTDFLINAKYALERQAYALAAFELHQATESFYGAILLVFSGYKPKLHDIRKLGSLASNYSEELWGIFPHSSNEQRKYFKLLEKAYVEARYEKDYFISKEQLLYLIERVEELQKITEKICLARINQDSNKI